eukprot:comp22231_c0_seq1/m.32780 comp22231_c0_seq1/g.32780  ORF comp22231_c0_seq1/g.32780 comp22231_c0_seq1/m.32780 type:complete len:739 (-) comp22231_c0_seq1:582-2798(-)
MNSATTRKSFILHPNGVSPLRKFAACKVAISQQFTDLKDVIESTGEFLSDIERFDTDPTIKEQKAIHEFQEVVDNIVALLRRDNMKVVFVGHTSNGKSTVINSMLWQTILPVGIGHTTNCFCSVEGTEEEPYMMVGEGGQRQSITNVKQVAHALAKGSEENGQAAKPSASMAMVKVFWDKKVCRLLGDGVCLIDTPGLDMDEHYDSWIDKFCHDADVFVLVANAESTLKHTEKTFFTEVAKKLSKPNVFLLYNRWDGSDDEDGVAAVREQHFTKAANFLTQELGLAVDPAERVFFVSGKETLLHRTRKEYKGMDNPESQARYEDFKRFEKLFEECISESAIRTKFEAHIVRGLDIVIVLEEWLERLVGDVQRQQKIATSKLDDRRTRLRELETHGGKVLQRCDEIAVELEQRVTQKVADAFNDLVEGRLYDIVAGFDYCVFKPETITKYKERLLEHTGAAACEALRAHSDKGIAAAYRDSQEAMVARVAQVMQDRMVSTSIHTFKRPTVTPDQLATNVLPTFKEDIDFRFSLGWHALGPKIFGGSSYSLINVALTGSPVKGAEMAGAEGAGPHAVIPFVSALLNPASVLSLTTVVVTLITKPSVWKVVLGVGGIYGALYGWEYLTYTNAAKERRFKAQFMAHFANHLRGVAPQVALAAGKMYSGSIRDLQLKQLACQIDEAKGALHKEKGTLERDIAERSRVITHGQTTLDRAMRTHRNLKEFYRENVRTDSVEFVDA